MTARNISSTCRSISVTRSMAPFFSTWRSPAPASCIAPAWITVSTAVARKIGGSASATDRQLLHHAHTHSAVGRALELHVVHEAAHEEDAAAARLEDVFGIEGIRDGLGIEPFALVTDADDELCRAVGGHERELDGDQLAGMLTVAVLDRVDHRFAHGDTDPVHRVLVHGGELSHAIAEDLHEIQHVEQAWD